MDCMMSFIDNYSNSVSKEISYYEKIRDDLFHSIDVVEEFGTEEDLKTLQNFERKIGDKICKLRKKQNLSH